MSCMLYEQNYEEGNEAWHEHGSRLSLVGRFLSLLLGWVPKFSVLPLSVNIPNLAELGGWVSKIHRAMGCCWILIMICKFIDIVMQTRVLATYQMIFHWVFCCSWWITNFLENKETDNGLILFCWSLVLIYGCNKWVDLAKGLVFLEAFRDSSMHFFVIVRLHIILPRIWCFINA